MCRATQYNLSVIRNYRHAGLEEFARTGNTKGITPEHAKRIAVRIDVMEAATELLQVNLPSWYLHQLKGDRAGEWSLSLNRIWRLTFRWDEESKEFYDVHYEQYH